MPITRAYGQASQLGNTPAASNPVLNSAFQIWQRGTSISVAASTTAYTADRWTLGTNANQACTVSRQSTNDTTNLPNIQYCARVQRNSGQTGTGTLHWAQSFETINTIPFAGKTVTLSFYARKGADYSPTGSALTVYLIAGTGTDQARGSGSSYTGETYPINNQTATLTTTWQRFSYTGTIGATMTEMAPYFDIPVTGTAGTNDYFEITGVQIDIGSVALPFRTNGATLAGELAACQRYYYRQSGGDSYGCFATGAARSTTVVYAFMPLPVTMRVVPTSMDLSTISVEDYSGSTYNTGTFTLESGGQQKNTAWIRYTHGSAVFTQYRPAFLSVVGSSSAYIGFSAEL